MKLKISLCTILCAAIILSAASLAVMLLWNGVVPDLFGLKSISFFQASALFILSQLLTGGFGMALLSIGGMIHGMTHYNNPAKEKWNRMTDEQRKDFIERRRRSGIWRRRASCDEETEEGNKD